MSLVDDPTIIQPPHAVTLFKMNAFVHEFDPVNRIVTGIVSGEIVDNQGDFIPTAEFEKIAPIMIRRQTPICDSHTSKVHGKLLDIGKDMIDDISVTLVKFQVFKDWPSDDRFWNKIISGEYPQLSMRGEGMAIQKCDDTTCWNQVGELAVLEISGVKGGSNPLADILLQKSKDARKATQDEGYGLVKIGGQFLLIRVRNDPGDELNDCSK